MKEIPNNPLNSDVRKNSINMIDNKKDRLLKYGFGFIRLSIIFYLMVYFDKELKLNILLESNRWLIYILFSISGGCFNVKILPKKLEIIVLFLVVLLAFYELTFDFTVLLYATKTFIPDFFASKLDRKIWKFLLILSIVGIIGYCFLIHNGVLEMLNFWIFLALSQLFCELGDQYSEDMIFFRHRYSFELASLLVWYYVLPIGPRPTEERKLFYFDLIASLSYRITGFVLKLIELDKDLEKKYFS